MAAITFEGANLTWQRVKEFLEGVNACQASKKTLLWSLKQWIATQKGNPKLSFLSFSDANVTTAGGIQLGTGTPKIVAAYAIKLGTTITGAGTSTVSYIKINDDATDDTTAANQRIVLPLLAAKDEAVFVYPQPNKASTAFANGVVVGADTTVNGSTDSTAGDAGPGFVIVSA